jgi:hypothetical protein
MTYEHHVQDI